jgi:GrpB-like predicted nucleotidyltransferase (UPF0157 family)
MIADGGSAVVTEYDPRLPRVFERLRDRLDAALAAAGWQHEGDLGIKGREAFLSPADAAYHHLYLVVAGSRPHRDHIDLRDFLRTHPGRAARYGALKRQFAVLLETDRGAYARGKEEMITEFLRLARREGTSGGDS